MARSARYCVPYRRRRDGKTDYEARRAFIVAGKPRLVVRGSIKNVITQILLAKPRGDEVLVSAHSRELMKSYGWKGSGGNVSAAYLTGFLCGHKAKAKGVEEAIPDIGLRSPSKGARIFAALKGVLDAGIEVPHSEEKLPDEKRIGGEHISKYAESLSPGSEEYQVKFSGYLERKLQPETLPDHFAQVKKDIVAAFKKGGKEK